MQIEFDEDEALIANTMLQDASNQYITLLGEYENRAIRKTEDIAELVEDIASTIYKFRMCLKLWQAFVTTDEDIERRVKVSAHIVKWLDYCDNMIEKYEAIWGGDKC